MNLVLTGGGTAGHAMVNTVLAPLLQARSGCQVLAIGSHRGAERALMRQAGVTYFPISTGKLRRYASLENVRDFFRVWQGLAQAYRILKREQVDVVFSGGGFVSLPVVLAARLLGIPVLIRETDLTMGLANRICVRFAQKIITTFPDTLGELGGRPSVCGGLIIRPALLRAAEPGRALHGRPNVLVMGGSLGSGAINRVIWENLQELTRRFPISHLCGPGQINPAAYAADYVQRDYADDMTALYAQADVVVTRCGSNAISEGLALGKRMVCIPLSTRFSRGEQLANAEYARRHGNAVVLEEEQLGVDTLTRAIDEVLLQPTKRDCVLSERALAENCTLLVREMEHAAGERA